MTSRTHGFAFFLAVTTAGCAGGAEVKVAFDHQSGAHTSALTAADGHTPGVFGLKLVALYLSGDVDPGTMNNQGEVGRIWTNDACDAELHHCSIGPEGGAYQLKEYFDLALPSDEVNARLNAQGAMVKPGTYRYLRMDMAGILDRDKNGGKNDPNVPNLRFGDDAASAREVRFASNQIMVPLDPPMVVGDGDAVTVTLGYDLAGSYFSAPELDAFHPPDGTSLSDWYCGDLSRNPAHGPCLRFTTFTPAVTRTAAMPASK
jgi:hypothetical protein